MKVDHTKDLVILKVFESAFAANMAQARLQEAGIESFVEEENVMGLNPLGEAELKVSASNVEKARQILSL